MKNPSSVEYQIKRIFLSIAFFPKSYLKLTLCEHSAIFVVSLYNFRIFFRNLAEKMFKRLMNVLVFSTLSKKWMLNCLTQVFLNKILGEFLKNDT